MAEVIEGHVVSVNITSLALNEHGTQLELAVKVRAVCTSGCDLEKGRIQIVDDRGTVVKEEISLGALDGAGNETNTILVPAPSWPGNYTWTAVFSEGEPAAGVHKSSTTPVAFVVPPHRTRVDVLDVPDPVTPGVEFQIKLRLTCTLGCDLAGAKANVFDDEGVKLATATLKAAAPWRGLAACEAVVKLSAPKQTGRVLWSVKLPAPETEIPHSEGAANFHFAIAPKGDCTMSIEAIDSDTQLPMEGATVVIRPTVYNGCTYSEQTNAAGIARVTVPKGEYHLFISGNGKESFHPVVKVYGDVTIQAKLAINDAPPF